MTVWLWSVTTTPTWKSAVNFFTGRGKLDLGFAKLTFSFVVTPTMLDDCPTLTSESVCCALSMKQWFLSKESLVLSSFNSVMPRLATAKISLSMLGRMTERLVQLERLVRLLWTWWEICTIQPITCMLTISIPAKFFSSYWRKGESLLLGQLEHAKGTHMNNWKGLSSGNREKWHVLLQRTKEWQLCVGRTKKIFPDHYTFSSSGTSMGCRWQLCSWIRCGQKWKWCGA